MFGFFSWLFAIYFAKILLALLVGGLILGATEKRDSMPLALLAGLTAISVMVNMPFIGGILNFVLTIIGIGLLLHVVLTHLSNLNAGEIA